MSARAVSSPVGVALLVLVTVASAGALGAVVMGLPGDVRTPTHVAVRASADASGRIAVTHVAGPPLNVHALDVTVTVDGEPLAHQPPVPFFAAEGFASGPTGAFNVAGDGSLSVGETATFQVADTNAPALDAGVTVTVTLSLDGQRVAVVATVVRPAPATLGAATGALSRDRSGSGRQSVDSGTRATVVMARGLPGRACWTR